MTRKPVAVGWRRGSPQHRRPFPHPDQARGPRAAAGPRSACRAALVVDRDLDASAGSRRGPRRPPPACSASFIASWTIRYARPPAPVPTGAARPRPRGPRRGRPIGAGRKVVEAVDPRRRTQAPARPDAEHSAHVGQRESTGRRDRLEGHPRLVGALLDDPRAPPASITVAPAWCLTTSCSSRAIRSRSSQRRARRSSRSRSSRTARSSCARVQPPDPRRVAEQPSDQEDGSVWTREAKTTPMPARATKPRRGAAPASAVAASDGRRWTRSPTVYAATGCPARLEGLALGKAPRNGQSSRPRSRPGPQAETAAERWRQALEQEQGDRDGARRAGAARPPGMARSESTRRNSGDRGR